MKELLVALAVFAVSCVFVPVVVSAKTESPAEEGPSFSNQDLEKYKSPADNASVPGGRFSGKIEERKKTSGRDDQREKEYWCRRAREYQKKVDSARDELKSRDEESRALDSSDMGPKKHKVRKPTQKKYAQAKKQLRDAQRDLSYLEEEAHRKDIPPGWLRCQFE